MKTIQRIFKRSELAGIPIRGSDEGLIDVCAELPTILCRYEKPDMIPIVGRAMFVREGLIDMLASAQADIREDPFLRSEFPGQSLGLMMVYGYRSPEIQKKYFEARCAQFRDRFPDMPEDELLELAHICSADPDVAGHVTGGAVDVTIIADGKQVDMGSKIADFSDVDLMQPFSNKIRPEQLENRMVLRRIMMGQGFAPFDGEYWHFSYGDREWAAWYGKEEALYGSIDFCLS